MAPKARRATLPSPAELRGGMNEISDDRRSGSRPVPLVSVICTTFNHARYVEEALESLRRQTARDFEVIITDDASTDGCADVIQGWLDRTGFPAQFIRNQANRGICANRNTALARASGTFVCSLPGDDVYETEYIERQLRCFLPQPDDVCAVYSDALVIDADGRRYGPSYLDSRLGGTDPPQGNIFSRLLQKNCVPAPAVMLRKGAIAAVGGYDESLFYEDLDMWLRLSSRYRFVFSPERLVRIRTHPESMSNNPRNGQLMCSSRTRIFAKWLDAGLDVATRSRLLDALLWNGLMQLRINDPDGARVTFSHVIRSDVRITQRSVGRAGRLPGAGMVIRLLLPFYRLSRIRWSS
jgi:glycosyltransferase involved in cell wall biosynthesis